MIRGSGEKIWLAVNGDEHCDGSRDCEFNLKREEGRFERAAIASLDVMYDRAMSPMGLLGTGLALAPNLWAAPNALFVRPYGRYAVVAPKPYFSLTDSAGLGSREGRRIPVAGLGSLLRTLLLLIAGLGSRVFLAVPSEADLDPTLPSLPVLDIRPVRFPADRFESAGLGSRDRNLLAAVNVGIFFDSAGLGSRECAPGPVFMVIELVNRCF